MKKTSLRARFWGVRGSIPTPGGNTVLVGGNTSCVEIASDHGRLILDAGSGLRALGDELLKTKQHSEIHLALSHVHWDHIMGLPFFVPLYLPTTHITFYAGASVDLDGVLRRQMGAPVFPVDLSKVGASIRHVAVEARSHFHVGSLLVTATLLNHPDPVMAYRVSLGDRSIVYATDHEHGGSADDALIELARGTDALIYDSQYTPEEYPSKVGWGHSTYEAGARIARAAGAKTLVLFHHDPNRGDAEVAEITKRAAGVFPNSVAAREGMSLEYEVELDTHPMSQLGL